MTIKEVPERWRTAVQAMLDADDEWWADSKADSFRDYWTDQKTHRRTGTAAYATNLKHTLNARNRVASRAGCYNWISELQIVTDRNKIRGLPYDGQAFYLFVRVQPKTKRGKKGTNPVLLCLCVTKPENKKARIYGLFRVLPLCVRAAISWYRDSNICRNSLILRDSSLRHAVPRGRKGAKPKSFSKCVRVWDSA